MHVNQASIEPEQLPQWMQRAEQGSLDSSLQWSWGEPDTIRTLAVEATSTTDSSPDGIEGLHRLPGLAPPPTKRAACTLRWLDCWVLPAETVSRA